ncbi:MAG: TetR/AcrR family transcriptional regulator C-terminal domain-containing protein [Hyphomicrobiaceae bacterium]|nr:TetR/AcrR family transcriptional regulator C-terminal domain-containing protein [Hyphomicrobiaceae bacterium]
MVIRAISMADQFGIENLSMRRLAGAFGVTAMSLYNHVANKNELIDLMLNQVAAEIEIPSVDGQWQEMMRRRAHSMRRMFLRHRWVPPLLISQITLGQVILRDIDATVGCLVTNGFSYAEADWVRNAIDSHVYGYTLQELNFPVEPSAYRDAAATYLPEISSSDYPFMHAAALQIVSGAYDGVTDFSFGLELLLEGLENWQHQTNRQTSVPRPRSG